MREELSIKRLKETENYRLVERIWERRFWCRDKNRYVEETEEQLAIESKETCETIKILKNYKEWEEFMKITNEKEKEKEKEDKNCVTIEHYRNWKHALGHSVVPPAEVEKDENENGCPTGTKGTLIILQAIAIALAAYWVIYNFTQ